MAGKETDRPNVLWICADMWRHDAISALGNRFIRTPNVDRLISRGVTFTRAYCQNGVCAPSRASFLTGRYTSTDRVVGNGQTCFTPGETLVTKVLADAGYDCGLIGKLHLAAVFERVTDPATRNRVTRARTEPRADDGYRVFHWNHDPMNVWPEGDEYHQWIDRQGIELHQLRREGRIPETLHQATWCADRAIDFINTEADRPWLLSLNFFHPHGPFDVPTEKVRDRFDIDTLPGPIFRDADLATQNEYLKDIDYGCTPAARLPGELDGGYLDSYLGRLSELGGDPAKRLQAAYWTTVEWVDTQIGRVVEVLEAADQSDNTVVIFHADHGIALGDHGLFSAGCRFYECDMHVPLVISWPAHFKQGLHAEGLVELIDLAPTLLDLAGLPVSQRMNGQSLLPVLKGQADPSRIKDGVRSEYYFSFDPGTDTIQGTYGTMHRDDRYKLCVYHGHDVGELYDMQEDPEEFENLWDSPAHADIKHRLIKASFDRCMLTIDRGPERIGHA